MQFREETDSRGEVVRNAFAPAWAAIEDLEPLREDIDAYDGPMDSTNEEFADEVFPRYTTIIEAFFDGTSQVALTVDDASLRNGVEIVDASTRQGEIRARIVRSIVLATDHRHRSTTPASARRSPRCTTVAASSTTPSAPTPAAPTPAWPTRPSPSPASRASTARSSPTSPARAWRSRPLLGAVAADPDIGYTGLRTKAAGLLAGEAQRLEDDAVARMRLFAGIALGGLLVALLVTWLASRSITRPLRSLKEQAEEMAGTRLPAAVRQILDTPAGEDVVIPEVAADHRQDAATRWPAWPPPSAQVQSSAVDLAVEQAVLRRNISDSYINLGRRNQNLLSRQLDFITELERNEADPDTLEGLFRLDHLATRMRRNAESLLVLAGIEPPRQWSAPVKVADVVRAALGEVEDYQRVVVRHLEPAAVTGAVAADVAHVLAELIENALSFSPPDQTVEVKGRLATAGYTVAITDNGLGMAAGGRGAGQPPPGRQGELHGRAVPVPRALRGRPPGQPPRHRGRAAGQPGRRHHRTDRRADGPARRRRARPAAWRRLRRRRPPSPSPSPPARSAAAVSTETTVSGLPRRGDAERARSVAALRCAAATRRARRRRPAPPQAPAVARRPDSRLGPRHRSRPEPDADRTARGAVDARDGQRRASEAWRCRSRPAPRCTASPPTTPATARQRQRHQRREPPRPPRAAWPGACPARSVPTAAVRTGRSEPGRPPSRPARRPEDVYSFLSNFQSGVARGRADAASRDPRRVDQEDGR